MDNKYYTNYTRFTYGFSYEDQERYGELEELLNQIESKEVVSEEEYENEIGRFESIGDIEGLDQYRNRYITEVEYHFSKEEIQEEMRKIEEMYRVTAEQLAEDKAMRAKYAKDRLRLIKRAYESRNVNNIMRNVNVESLSDDEAIEMYRHINVGLSDEIRHELETRAVRDRVGSNRPIPTDKKNIEDKIKTFNSHADKMREHLQKIKATFVLDDIAELDVSDEIKSIDAEMKELDSEADNLIAEIDNFKAMTGASDFSMSVKEITKVMNELKGKVRDLKRKQVELYNVRVDSVNERISELKSLSIENPEVVALIEQLNLISRCSAKVENIRWDTNKYISEFNYSEIIRAEKIISEIVSREKIVVTEKDNFETHMSYIEESIVNMDNLIKDGLSNEELSALKQGLIMVSDDINSYRILLENSKDTIGERYQGYLDRINDAEANLSDLNYRLSHLKTGNGTVPVEPTKKSDYEELMEKLNTLQLDVVNYVDIIESLFGKVVESALSVYRDKLDVYEFNLNIIKSEIEERKNNGKFEDNQYDNLMKKVEEIELIIKNGREKAKDPKMIVDADIFAYLNKKIDGVEKALDTLEAEVEALGKPIKDRNIRKHLDKVIDRIEEEIKDISVQLEKYKDEEPEKYQEAKGRLDAANQRLDKISKKYRTKCPLRVRVVKTAKEFYKKHKKIALITAGLAAIALIHATVGPILIPAIMHGNLMIGYSVPALKGFVMFANDILGGLIGATKVANVWQLANGVIINPTLAATSLLKGVAISGIGSSLMVAPIVVSIKKLIDKMKTINLKQKLNDEIKKGKEKKESKTKKEKKPKMKNVGKKTEEEIIQLFRKFKKSSKTIEEFCEEEELTEEDKMILELFEERYKKNVEAEKESGRKGRR